MKVLIGVDPHKASVALAAVDEDLGELLERAAFPQNRDGLRSLERWARRFPERRPKRWRTPAAWSRNTAEHDAATVPPARPHSRRLVPRAGAPGRARANHPFP